MESKAGAEELIGSDKIEAEGKIHPPGERERERERGGGGRREGGRKSKSNNLGRQAILLTNRHNRTRSHTCTCIIHVVIHFTLIASVEILINILIP